MVVGRKPTQVLTQVWLQPHSRVKVRLKWETVIRVVPDDRFRLLGCSLVAVCIAWWNIRIMDTVLEQHCGWRGATNEVQ